jgi:IS6 family transposase
MVACEGESGGMRRSHARPLPAISSSAFAGFGFPPEVIVLAVRWYLRFGLSCRDIEGLLVERGIEVDHVTVDRWVQRFPPLLADGARPCRHAVGDRWFVDETYVMVAGRWRYVYRAVDQHGQVIDVYVSPRRDTGAARRFCSTALSAHGEPAEVVSDRAWALCTVIGELIPSAFHNTEQYANNRIEADHGRLTARLRPMRGLKRDCTARVIMRGHAFLQNLRPRVLRTRCRRPPMPSGRGRVYRARPSHLNPIQDAARSHTPGSGLTQQSPISKGPSVVVGDEGSQRGLVCALEVPYGGGERKEALLHAGGDTGRGACAVSFEVELAFEGVVDRLDDLAEGFRQARAGSWPLVLRITTLVKYYWNLWAMVVGWYRWPSSTPAHQCRRRAHGNRDRGRSSFT